MIKTTLHINPAKTLSYIAPEIYGQFSEHLGRCIYDGIYVGEDSEIPNKNGMRNDVVDALRALKRAAALRMNITGETASDRKRNAAVWSTPTGEARLRITALEHMNLWSCATSLAVNRTLL